MLFIHAEKGLLLMTLDDFSEWLLSVLTIKTNFDRTTKTTIDSPEELRA